MSVALLPLSCGTVAMLNPAQALVIFSLLSFSLSSSISPARLQSPWRNHVAIPYHGQLPLRYRAVIDSCWREYFTQPLDHYNSPKDNSTAGRTWVQRYFFCDEFWRKDDPGSPIFFYAGNEADVTLYLNATGLMWENAKSFGALLIFAEHRYYGESQPFRPDEEEDLSFLRAEQALADYSLLVNAIKEQYGVPRAPVIAFGGSYGGMLAAWWRLKYPAIVTGAIAASAPMLDFVGLDDKPWSVESFAAIVTRDASPAAGASQYCADNVRRAWTILFDMAVQEGGLTELAKIFKLCKPEQLSKPEDVYYLAFWAQDAYTSMAMGNYPYPSTYLLNGQGYLPAWPMQAACKALDFDGSLASNTTLLEGLRESAATFYNYTGKSLNCFDLRAGANEANQVVQSHWNYQYCSEMFMPMGNDGVHDMFFPQPWDADVRSDYCLYDFGFRPRQNWVSVEYGGIEAFRQSSNIVFSNGRLDPWSGTGILYNLTQSVVSIIIDLGAHHLDLMFSTPEDPADVRDARAQEVAYIKQWVSEHRAAHAISAEASEDIPHRERQGAAELSL